MADGALPHLRASALDLKRPLFLPMSRNPRYFLCSSGTSPCMSGRARAQTYAEPVVEKPGARFPATPGGICGVRSDPETFFSQYFCFVLPSSSRDLSPLMSLGIFSEATDGTICPGVDSASKNVYQENSWG